MILSGNVIRSGLKSSKKGGVGVGLYDILLSPTRSALLGGSHAKAKRTDD